MQPYDVTGPNGQLYVNVTYEYLSLLTGNNNPLPNWVEFLDNNRCFYTDETNPTVGLGLMLPPQDINSLPSRKNPRLVRGRLISAKSDFYWVEGANDIVAKLLDTPDINHFNEVNHEIVATLYCLCSARAIKLSRHISIGNDNGIYNFPCQIDADWSAIIANRINADNTIDIVSGQFCDNSEEENFSVNGDDVDLILNDNGAIWEKHNTWLLTCDNEVEVETLNFNKTIIRFKKSDNNKNLWTCDPTPLALSRQFQPDLKHLSNKNFVTIRCRLRWFLGIVRLQPQIMGARYWTRTRPYITNGAFIINIHPIAGDIFEIAPKVADAAILYLKSGFCMREVTWMQIRENWCPHAFHPNLHNIDGRPWEHSADVLYRVHIPGSQLRFIYIFSNPNNSRGFTTLENLELSLIRSLNSLSDLNITRISLIHIPFVAENKLPTLENNICSANLMVRTLQNWNLENPSVFSDAYLVDLSDGFRKQITF